MEMLTVSDETKARTGRNVQWDAEASESVATIDTSAMATFSADRTAQRIWNAVKGDAGTVVAVATGTLKNGGTIARYQLSDGVLQAMRPEIPGTGRLGRYQVSFERGGVL